MTPTDSLRRFFDWLETEKPDTRKAHAMLRKNVRGIARDAVTAAERDVERRLGPADDGRCWEFRECLRDLSFAHLRLFEERERMHAQVPEGERGPGPSLHPKQREMIDNPPDLRVPWFAGRRDGMSSTILDEMYRVTKRHNEQLVGVDWGREYLGEWQVTNPPPGAERKRDPLPDLERIPEPKLNPDHFDDRAGPFPDFDPAKHVDPTIPEGHVRIDGRLVKLEPECACGQGTPVLVVADDEPLCLACARECGYALTVQDSLATNAGGGSE